jgi:hypothetical protein
MLEKPEGQGLVGTVVKLCKGGDQTSDLVVFTFSAWLTPEGRGPTVEFNGESGVLL